MKQLLPYVAIVCSCLWLAPVRAQLMLERSAMGSFVLNGQAGGVEVFSMGGQAVDATIGDDPFYLTQGFEQPLDKGPLEVTWETSFDACEGIYHITITELGGCATATTAVIQWNGTAGTADYSTTTPQAELTVVGPVGCYEVFAIDLSAAPLSSGECGLVFYSYISPNGDGQNDTWIIERIALAAFADNTVEIFNRWGQSVWKAHGYDNTSVVFDGRNTDKTVLPDGTYFYVVTTGGVEYTGFIELAR